MSKPMASGLGIALISAGLMMTTQAGAQVTFYEGEEFRGATFRIDTSMPNFDPLGFSDRATSAVVEQGRWQVCEEAGFRGRCTILGPGNYPSLAPMGFNNRISGSRCTPTTGPTGDSVLPNTSCICGKSE